jgi:Methyltransferase domain
VSATHRFRSVAAGTGKRFAAALGVHVARRRNWNVVPRSYYSPVPDLEHVPGDVWERRSALRGIGFDSARQIEFAERELRPYLEEARFPRHGDWSGGRFFLDNRGYETVDAEVLYAMVRRFKPARIIELGSGWSTLAMAQACEANRSEGADTQLVAYEPYPRGNVPLATPGLSALRRVKAQDVPLTEFESLDAGDVLFVDTTHTVKLGGDVNFIVLEVLPTLRPGVLVHFHDIWLPYEYHRMLVEGMRMYWAEQYLLQAFLSCNPSYEVVWGSQAVWREQRDRLERLIPSTNDHQFPSAFWLRRT